MGGRPRGGGGGGCGWGPIVLALSALVWLHHPRGVAGTVVSGTVDTSNCYAFIDRYALKGASSGYKGLFRLNISFPTNMTHLAWVLYYSDNSISWAEVDGGGLSCPQMVAAARDNVFEVFPQRTVRLPSGEQFSISERVLRFTNSVTRTFYLGVVNTDLACSTGACDGPLFNISYSALFIQVEEDNLGSLLGDDEEEDALAVNQASYDESMLLTFYAITTGVSLAIVMWASILAYKLFADDKFHRVYQVLMLSIQCGCLGLGLQLVHRSILQAGIYYDSVAFADIVPIMGIEELLFKEGMASRYEDMTKMLPPGKGVLWLDQDSQYVVVVVFVVVVVAGCLFFLPRSLDNHLWKKPAVASGTGRQERSGTFGMGWAGWRAEGMGRQRSSRRRVPYR
jgi:hypothetical protein